MKTIWIIEDEELLRIMYLSILRETGAILKPCSKWSDCMALPGDIIVHDFFGVGEEIDFPGTIKISVSGSFEFSPTFSKPFRSEEFISYMNRIVA